MNWVTIPLLMNVAPFMGAWIEIDEVKQDLTLPKVAPFMGAWIEITNKDLTYKDKVLSHPLCKR